MAPSSDNIHKNTENAAVKIDNLGQQKAFLSILGRGAVDFLQPLVAGQIAKLAIGEISYGSLNSQNLPDILCYRRGKDGFLLCVDIAHGEEVFTKLAASLPLQGVLLENVSLDYAAVAVHGVQSPDIVSRVVDVKIGNLHPWHFTEGKIFGVPGIIALMQERTQRQSLFYELLLPRSMTAKILRGLEQEIQK